MKWSKIIFIALLVAGVWGFSIPFFTSMASCMMDDENKTAPTAKLNALSEETMLREKAVLFHKLHTQSEDEPLIIPNAWDALSAKIYENTGAQAIATTSSGIAAIFGYADGELLPKDLLFTMVKSIVNSVSVPVSVDLEAGYGQSPEEVYETVSTMLKIGAVGINIEDANPRQPGELFSITEQTTKIKAIKELAQKQNIPLFINARTDIFWLNLFTQETRLNEAIVRLKAYQEAGADGVFVPGLTDPESISEITKSIHVPLNLLAGEWVKDTKTLKSLGVSRLTIGSSAIRDVTGHLEQRARQVINEKTFFTPQISYDKFNSLFSSKK